MEFRNKVSKDFFQRNVNIAVKNQKFPLYKHFTKPGLYRTENVLKFDSDVIKTENPFKEFCGTEIPFKEKLFSVFCCYKILVINKILSLTCICRYFNFKKNILIYFL